MKKNLLVASVATFVIGIVAIVSAQLMADYSLLLSTTTVSLAPAGQAQVTVTLNSTGGFSAPIHLSVAGLPEGVSAAFSDPAPILPPDGSVQSVLIFSASANAQPTTATITVTGDGDGVVRSEQLALLVVGTLQMEAAKASLKLVGTTKTGPNDTIVYRVLATKSGGTFSSPNVEKSAVRISFKTLDGNNFSETFLPVGSFDQARKQGIYRINQYGRDASGIGKGTLLITVGSDDLLLDMVHSEAELAELDYSEVTATVRFEDPDTHMATHEIVHRISLKQSGATWQGEL
jgi:hypothetical protein